MTKKHSKHQNSSHRLSLKANSVSLYPQVPHQPDAKLNIQANGQQKGKSELCINYIKAKPVSMYPEFLTNQMLNPISKKMGEKKFEL
jgi:hypothetical protein